MCISAHIGGNQPDKREASLGDDPTKGFTRVVAMDDEAIEQSQKLANLL
jgi:hypothetical protein